VKTHHNSQRTRKHIILTIVNAQQHEFHQSILFHKNGDFLQQNMFIAEMLKTKLSQY